MKPDYSKRGNLLPEGCKDLIDVLRLEEKTHVPLPGTSPSLPPKLDDTRTFTLAALLGIVALNCFLAYSGMTLAEETRRTATHSGVKLSVLAEVAIALQPWFYLLALSSFAVVGLGLRHKLSERALIYAIIGFLVLDIIGLLISLQGFARIYFLL